MSATSNHDISQNIARENSKQINAVSNSVTYNAYLTIHQHGRHDKLSTSFTKGLQERKTVPMSETLNNTLRDFFLSLVQGGGAKEEVEKKPPSCQHGDVRLPGLNMFKYEIRTHVARNEERLSVLNQLSDDHFNILHQWMGATDHQILLVAGNEGNGSWTTNLLLEITHLRPREHMVPFAAHLCGLNFNDKKRRRREFLIQDLIGQLIETYQDRFDGVRQSELMTQQPSVGNIEIGQFWDLFINCVKQTGIKKLLIVLGRVDYILAESDDATFSAFVKSLETISETLWDQNILVKIMVISGHLKVADYFMDIKAFRIIELYDPPS
ncbi:hypothetical protein F5B19DRAFT_495569 [Rostrohypoxylon terebratum]|nr:hypothetical protein F5B19DRAFT_495569 [Rostrohypoxylon terebratum]